MKRGFFPIFLKEAKRLLVSPRLLFLTIIVPIGLFYYYSSLLQQGVPRNLPVVLCDQDKTNGSRQLGRMLNATSALNIIAEVENLREGEKMVKTDRAMALFIIPKNFSKNIYNGVGSQVVSYYNNNYILSGSLINKAFQTTVGTFSAGVHIKSLTQKGLSSQQALANTSPITIKEHILFNPYTNYSYYLSIALMPMSFQIIIIVVTIYVLGSVLKEQKGRELLVSSKGNVWIAYWAKILPYTLLFSIIGFFMNSLLYYKVGVPLKGSFLYVNIYFIIYIIVCQLVALFFVSITSDLRTALTLGGGYTAISFSFAGYTFPKEGMPDTIQYLSYIFPFTSYLRFLVDYAIRGITFNIFELRYIIAFMFFCALGILSLPAYNRLLKKGRYYV